MSSGTVWQKAILSPLGLVKDAIKLLSETSLRIVLIADPNLKLLGTVTDGDIRRGLIRGLSIESPILEIVNTQPIVALQSYSPERVLKMMSANKVFQIPIVDSNFNLIGLHLWEEISTPIERENVMVIMAGGKGTRLWPKTAKTPKPMLPLGGKPILEHIITRAKSEGFNNFVLAIHYLGEVIEDYFKDGESLGVKISYVKENAPLGTAGALKLLDPRPSEPMIISNGDVITDIRYGDMLNFHIQHNAKATMAVQNHELRLPYGVVHTNGLNITSYEEKPTARFLINAGVYVISPECLSYLGEEVSVDMPNFFESLTSQGMSTLAFLVHEKWIDVGSPEDFRIASNAMSRNSWLSGEKS